MTLETLAQYFLDSPNLSICQSHFYAARVNGSWGEDVFDDALGEFPGRLVFLEDDEYTGSLIDMFSHGRVVVVHIVL